MRTVSSARSSRAEADSEDEGRASARLEEGRARRAPRVRCDLEEEDESSNIPTTNIRSTAVPRMGTGAVAGAAAAAAAAAGGGGGGGGEKGGQEDGDAIGVR